MLTVEYDEEHDEVVICFDAEGLRSLIREAEHLTGDDHAHLMTPSWSGHHLDERPLGKSTKLVHHLRLVRRERPW